SAAVVLHFQIGGGADPGPVVAHGRDESGGGGGPSRIGPLGGAEEVGPARVEAGGGPPGRGEEFRDRPRTCRGGAFPHRASSEAGAGVRTGAPGGGVAGTPGARATEERSATGLGAENVIVPLAWSSGRRGVRQSGRCS